MHSVIAGFHEADNLFELCLELVLPFYVSLHVDMIVYQVPQQLSNQYLEMLAPKVHPVRVVFDHRSVDLARRY